jgi:DNA-binding ferritin-like protein
MLNEVISKGLVALSDLANCVGGDFHTLHLNYVGEDFDNMHKKVLQKYYEQAADDYDSIIERARMFGAIAPATNESATRIQFQSQPAVEVQREEVVIRTNVLLEEYIAQMLTVYAALNQTTKDARCVGVANFLQGRIDYWTEEQFFFNKGRVKPLGAK